MSGPHKTAPKLRARKVVCFDRRRLPTQNTQLCAHSSKLTISAFSSSSRVASSSPASRVASPLSHAALIPSGTFRPSSSLFLCRSQGHKSINFIHPSSASTRNFLTVNQTTKPLPKKSLKHNNQILFHSHARNFRRHLHQSYEKQSKIKNNNNTATRYGYLSGSTTKLTQSNPSYGAAKRLNLTKAEKDRVEHMEKHLFNISDSSLPVQDFLDGVPSLTKLPPLPYETKNPQLSELAVLEKDVTDLIYNPTTTDEERMDARLSLEEVRHMKAKTELELQQAEQQNPVMFHFNPDKMEVSLKPDPNAVPENANFHGYRMRRQWTGKYEDLDQEQIHSRPFYPLQDSQVVDKWPSNLRPGINIGRFIDPKETPEMTYQWLAEQLYEKAHVLSWPFTYLNPFWYWFKIINRGYVWFAPRGRRKRNYWRDYAARYNQFRMLDLEVTKARAAYYRDSYQFYWIMSFRSKMRGRIERFLYHFTPWQADEIGPSEGPPLGLEPGRTLWIRGWKPGRIRFFLLLLIAFLLFNYTWGPAWHDLKLRHQRQMAPRTIKN